MQKELNITVDNDGHPLTIFVQGFVAFGHKINAFEPQRERLLNGSGAQLVQEAQPFVEAVGKVIDEAGEWLEGQLHQFDEPAFFGSHREQRLENGETLVFLLQKYRDVAVRVQRNCGVMPDFDNQFTVFLDRALNKTQRQMKTDA